MNEITFSDWLNGKKSKSSINSDKDKEHHRIMQNHLGKWFKIYNENHSQAIKLFKELKSKHPILNFL